MKYSVSDELINFQTLWLQISLLCQFTLGTIGEKGKDNSVWLLIFVFTFQFQTNLAISSMLFVKWYLAYPKHGILSWLG